MKARDYSMLAVVIISTYTLLIWLVQDPLTIWSPMAWNIEMCMNKNTIRDRWHFSTNQFICLIWNYWELHQLWKMWRFLRPYNKIRGCMDTEIVVHMVMQFIYSVMTNLRIEQEYKNCYICQFIPVVVTLSKHIITWSATLICYLMSKIEKKKPAKSSRYRKKEIPSKVHLKSILEVDSCRETSNIMSEVWEEGEDDTDDDHSSIDFE